jgi:hypothetical protein
MGELCRMAARRRWQTVGVSSRLVFRTLARNMRAKLGRVNDVEVSSDSPGFATVRVQAASGEREIRVVSDWPKRGARAGAEAVAEAIRQGISPEVAPRRE